MKLLPIPALAVLLISAPRNGNPHMEHGTSVVFSIMGNHAALAADSGTSDPRSNTHQTGRCKIDILTDPAALIGVGGAVVLGEDRWALDILATATREHRPVDQKSARSLVAQVKLEMDEQIHRYPILWGNQVDLQGVVIIPSPRGKGFNILIFQGFQKLRNKIPYLDLKDFDLISTEGEDHHGALEIGVKVLSEIDEQQSNRGTRAADELHMLKTPRDYVLHALDLSKRWYPENVFGTIDVATLEASGAAHLDRSTTCARTPLNKKSLLTN